MKLLKNLRIYKEMLQKDVADYLGVDRTTYVKYETGVSEPSFEMLLKLRELFGVSIDYMLLCTNEWEPDIYEDYINAKTDYIKMMLIYRNGLPSNYPDVAIFYDNQSKFAFSTDVHKNIDAPLAFAIRTLSEEQKAHLYSYISSMNGVTLTNTPLTEVEMNIVSTYRTHPEMQPAINTLLGINNTESSKTTSSSTPFIGDDMRYTGKEEDSINVNDLIANEKYTNEDQKNIIDFNDKVRTVDSDDTLKWAADGGGVNSDDNVVKHT